MNNNMLGIPFLCLFGIIVLNILRTSIEWIFKKFSSGFPTFNSIVYRKLFLVQFIFSAVAFFLGIIWFLFGIELLPNLHYLWPIVQRGSLGAISSVAGIMGISSILFGWAYGERDKKTLGKTQIQLIKKTFGPEYSASVVVHFGVTVLCLLLANIGARDGALMAFVALIWGCILHAIICVFIVMNRTNRERIALLAWKDDRDFASIDSMITFLNDEGVYYHKGYRKVLCQKIGDWIWMFRKKTKLGKKSPVGTKRFWMAAHTRSVVL